MNQKEFIVDHLFLLDKYDTEKLYKKLFGKEFTNCHNVHIDTSGNYLTHNYLHDGRGLFELNTDQSIGENYDRLLENIEAKGITIQRLRELCAGQYYFNSYGRPKMEGNKIVTYCARGSFLLFIEDLCTVINTCISEKFEDANTCRDTSLREQKKFTQTFLEIPYIVEVFQNGKIKISGLDAGHLEYWNKFLDDFNKL